MADGGPDPAGTMVAVTISREYGSGGGEIAARLARRLGWHLVDHEVVVSTAHLLGITEAEAAAHDEHVAGRAARFLDAALRNMQHLEGGGLLPVPASPGDELRRYQAALSQVVEAAVEAGRVVIVGRGAQVLLAARRDVLHVRVVAPLEQRIAYVVRREGLGPAAARARIQLKDQDRARYLQAQYHRRADDAHLYDLVVNTGVLALDDAVDLIALALERKGRRRAVPVEALGPAAGLAPYPGPAGDFRPPASEDARDA